ncbi:MAG: cell division protein ZapA [Elusimicrobiota bacterium]
MANKLMNKQESKSITLDITGYEVEFELEPGENELDYTAAATYINEQHKQTVEMYPKIADSKKLLATTTVVIAYELLQMKNQDKHRQKSVNEKIDSMVTLIDDVLSKEKVE